MHNPDFTLQEGTEKEWREWVDINSTNMYSFNVIKYANAWGKAMQNLMDQGCKIEDIAEKTSHEVDTGITGFMYGVAVGALAHFWIHGEGLRRWHNLKIQIGNEGERANENGGVLNPAVINLQEN